MTRPSIVLTSRELFPFGGGGIGTYVALTARALSAVADVTILTADWYEATYHELVEIGDPRVDYGGADVAFVRVPVPHEHGDFYAHMHLYSHRVLERLRALFPDGGPDLVEFPDYLGEGFIATQARRGGDPFLARTLLAVRLHTSAEMCDVLNGHVSRDFERRVSRDIERRTLRDADVLLYAGGDVGGTYRRYYGDELAPMRRVRHPLEWHRDDVPPAAPADGPLRMLCVGRAERRKGVQDLVATLTGMTAEWQLTLLGHDTATAPLGRSMRRTLELQVAGDPRVAFADAIARADLPAHMAEHDLVVLPSRWECWPYIALEAMAAGVPVAAPAVGGLREIVDPDATGFLAPGPGVEALTDLLGPLVAEPSRARERRDADAITRRLDALTDPDGIRDAYLEMLDGPSRAPSVRRPAPSDGSTPLVSVVVPYHAMHEHVTRTVESVFAQTYTRLEVIVVDDGSFTEDDQVLAVLASRYPLQVIAQENRGLGAARNVGIRLSRGRYVLPLDADNVLHPTFVARAVEVLETEGDVAFVTSWNRYVTEDGTPFPPPHLGYRPIGNWSALVEERNVAGDGTALLRRSVFDRHRYSEDLTAFEDWALYRRLHRAGLHGHVIPEMLWDYRIRESSMLREVGLPQEERLIEEMDAVIRDQEMTWVSTND